VKLRLEQQESDVQTIDPALMTALVALCVGALMAHAGVAKRQLTRRRRPPSRERRRRP
jgi:hypothetical protein